MNGMAHGFNALIVNQHTKDQTQTEEFGHTKSNLSNSVPIVGINSTGETWRKSNETHSEGNHERILGVRVKDNGNLLNKGADYAMAVFKHYEQSKTFGCALAMRVMQSHLYAQLDDVERAECDELLRRWFEHLKGKE